MRVSQLMSAILVLVVIFASAGCGRGVTPPGPGPTPVPGPTMHADKKIKCDNDVRVTKDQQHYPNGVDKETIYVCEDPPSTVTWNPESGVNTFSIVFHPDCPFQSCQLIDQDHRTATVSYTSTKPLKTFKYKITIDGSSPPEYDPHVVGGGGN
jgi:hypothetical protein